jgi:hypothetical protein
MKIDIGGIFKAFKTAKQAADQAAQNVSKADSPDPARPADPEEDAYMNTLYDIEQAYNAGDRELLKRNATAASAAAIDSWPFPPNPSFFVQKREKIDTASGPIVIATTVLKEPGKYYKRNLVLVRENGEWKYDIAQSEAHPVPEI